MARFRIRRATSRDFDVLVLHRRRMWEDMGERDQEVLDAADPVYRRWARQRMKTGRLVGWMAEDSTGRAVASGCLWLQPVQPRPARTYRESPYLLSMYTEPAARGGGLATKIVREAIRWCQHHGYKRMTLHASTPGRGVYRKLGFNRTWEMQLRVPPKKRAKPRRSR